LAGQQRLTPIAAGEDGDRPEAKRFARRNINRAVSNHHRLLGYHLKTVKRTLKVLRVRFDKTYDLPREKDITQAVDRRANRAHGGRTITCHHANLEALLSKDLENLCGSWQHAPPASAVDLERQNCCMRLAMKVLSTRVTGLAQLCSHGLDHL
jgi:hypothetical protein